MPRKNDVPPPPKPTRVKRVPAGWRPREDHDDVVRAYQEMHEGLRRQDIFDDAVEEYFTRRKMWPPRDR